MKMLIISLLLSGLIFSTGVKIANAQNQGSGSQTEFSNKKVSGSLNKLSKNAVSPNWFTSDKRLIAHYTDENNHRNKAVFTKTGTLIYHLTYGTEEKMPHSLRNMVKSNYFDYAITSAVKVHANESPNVWVVNVENAKEILVLRVEDGAMTIIRKITKNLNI